MRCLKLLHQELSNFMPGRIWQSPARSKTLKEAGPHPLGPPLLPHPACLFDAGGSEKLLRVCLNLPYFLRYINRFQDAVSANSFFIMPATVADATAVRNG